MSDLEWDAEDFVPPPAAPRVVSDKWDGEDEEDEVKESWDDDESKNDDTSQSTTTTAKKKKRKIADILAEKEKRKIEEMERRQRDKEEERRNMSAEDVLADKLQRQKLQEESDLELAINLLGDSKKESEPSTLDSFDLSTSDGLDGFRLLLLKRIRNIDRLEKKPFYLAFLEDFCRDLCENLETEDIKRVTMILNSLYNDKVKANKPTKGKKKAAGKAKLNLGQGAIADEVQGTYTFDEYDDFI